MLLFSLIATPLVIDLSFQDRSGKLASGAIANLVDEIGSTVIYDEPPPTLVSVDISIAYLSTANVDVRIILSSATQIHFTSPKTNKQERLNLNCS